MIPRYTISVASRLAGVPAHALRRYERAGLIHPYRVSGRNRLYSDADLARVRRIATLAREGVNLAGIKRILDLEDEVAQALPSEGRREPQRESQPA